MPETPRRQIVKLTAEITTAVAASLDTDKILGFEKSLLDLAEAIAARYFLQGPHVARADRCERPRVIYDIHHVTTYEYGSPVTFAHCALRLSADRIGPARRCLPRELTIDPAPAQMIERFCFFGNRVTSLTIETAHSRTDRGQSTRRSRSNAAPPPQAEATAPFEIGARRSLSTALRSTRHSPAHFLHPSRFVPRFAPASDYARESFSAGAPGARRRHRTDAAHQGRFQIRYQGDGGLDADFRSLRQKRRGVCQDFAHIMIAGLRGIGLPAAYICWLYPHHSARRQGAPRRRRRDARLGSLWCGEARGWVGLDPTNGMLIGNDHIVLAKGRDYADISPVAGIILGSREQDVDVEVDVVPRA